MKNNILRFLGPAVLVLVAGYYLYQFFFDNSELMLDYLEDTEEITNDYIQLLVLEQTVAEESESEDDLITFTEETAIPRLNELIASSNAVQENLSNEDLIEVHVLLTKSLETLLEANEVWLTGAEESFSLFTESDNLYSTYEDELDDLASSWNVEIIWEEPFPQE